MGKLKWSPYEYYTSSPQEFYYACKGYFDEKDNDMLVLRKVAYSFSGGPLHEWDKFWPVNQKSVDTVVMDEAMKRKILISNNLNPDDYIK